MPPNRFESEVESFLEGSHGDRTHIKRADHHTVTPLCGTLLSRALAALGAAGPPPNGGNGVTRGTTRRRHTANQLLMLQNPHRSQPRAPRRLQDLGAGPIGAKKLAPHGPSSGISAKKLPQQATKRQFWGVLSVQGELFRARGATTWRR